MIRTVSSVVAYASSGILKSARKKSPHLNAVNGKRCIRNPGHRTLNLRRPAEDGPAAQTRDPACDLNASSKFISKAISSPESIAGILTRRFSQEER